MSQVLSLDAYLHKRYFHRGMALSKHRRKQRRLGQKKERLLRRIVILIIIVLSALLLVLFLEPVFFGQAADSPVAEPSPAGEADAVLSYEGEAGAEVRAEKAEDDSSLRGSTVAVRPRLIIVIDDVGYNLEYLRPFLEVPVAISFAVLPQLAYSSKSAELIADAGQELILHLPMESLGGQDPGPGTLSATMSNNELQTLLKVNSATVPGIVGINNHMGSKGTEDERIVAQVLEHAQRQSLFFLDSRTTGNTVVPKIVLEYNVPFIERDVFLDNVREKPAIITALEEGKNIALQNGHAILIGHVWTQELAEVLLEHYQTIRSEGFDFVTLTTILGDE